MLHVSFPNELPTRPRQALLAPRCRYLVANQSAEGSEIYQGTWYQLLCGVTSTETKEYNFVAKSRRATLL